MRDEWITQLVARKQAPKDAAAFVAITLTRHAVEATNYTGKAQTLLGFEGFSQRERLADLVENDPRTAAKVNLAIALAIRENHTSRESWRHPNPMDSTYLLQLEAWGYHLSPVERIAAGYPEPDDTPDAA